jgi:hypothetical protein
MKAKAAGWAKLRLSATNIKKAFGWAHDYPFPQTRMMGVGQNF